ncbi:hypothetical protein BDR03DRAFT_455975 [Suillus americanus]|nr:hypothetical protein BDR03DRAFT_455975 [Suillus americanus]
MLLARHGRTQNTFAKVVSCWVSETYLDIDIPMISLFQDALDLRSIGYLDCAVTQLHLTIALLYVAKQRFLADAGAAEELMSEVLNVCLVDSHVYRAAVLVIKTSAMYPAGSIDANDLGQERLVGSMLPLSPNQPARVAERCWRTDEVMSPHYNSATHIREQLLYDFGTAMLIRIQRQGDGQDVDKSIAFPREVMTLRPASGLPGSVRVIE